MLRRGVPLTTLPWPQRTTAAAGACLLIAALLESVPFLPRTVALSGTTVVAMPYGVALWGAAVLLLAAFLVLALGAPGELGVAGASRAGRVALMVFGARLLAVRLLTLLPAAALLPVAAVLIPLLTIVADGAGVVAAVAVLRARVLLGTARWALVPVVAVALLADLVALAPGPLVLLVPESAYVARPVVLALAGAVLLGFGRSQAVRHRLRTIRDGW